MTDDPGPLDARADALLAQLATIEPRGSDLGVPELPEPHEIGELESLGPRIVPHLLDVAERSEPRVTAYAVMLLGRLGDATVTGSLRAICDRYRDMPDKGPWEYAVLGQCELAKRALAGRGANGPE